MKEDVSIRIGGCGGGGIKCSAARLSVRPRTAVSDAVNQVRKAISHESAKAAVPFSLSRMRRGGSSKKDVYLAWRNTGQLIPVILAQLAREL